MGEPELVSAIAKEQGKQKTVKKEKEKRTFASSTERNRNTEQSTCFVWEEIKARDKFVEQQEES